MFEKIQINNLQNIIDNFNKLKKSDIEKINKMCISFRKKRIDSYKIPNFHKNKTLGKPVDLNNSNALIGYKKYFINKNLNAIDDDIKYYFDKLNDNEKKIYQYENEQSGGSRKRNKTKKHKTKKRKTKHKTKKRKTKKRKTN